MEVELVGPIAALFFSLFICFVYFSKKRIDLLENSMYSIMLVCVPIDSLLVIIEKLLVMGKNIIDISVSSQNLVFLFNRFDALILMVITTCIFLYIHKITLEIKDNSFKNVCFIMFLMNIVAFVISMFLDMNLIQDGNIVSVTGSALYPAYIMCCINIVLSVLICLLNIKKITVKHLPLLVTIFVFVILLLIFSINPFLTIISLSLTFINMTMYFTIENPDVKMIKELDTAKVAAEKANRAKSDFLSSMSHEIRTPLNAIVGFSDCILEEQTLDACQQDAKDIKLASENLLEIVNGILDISKIEADKMEIVETDYNIKETLENVAKLVKPRIGEKPIELITNFATDLPYKLHGDGGKLRQIITNLLTNAAKYTEKGSINFNASCINDGSISKLVISVEDTGRGIKKEQIDKLFTKFQRLDEDKNTTLEGTGLGLAITKRFVEMMGGKIVVQSVYGSGSKFTVYLSQNIVELEHSEEDLKNELSSLAAAQEINYSNKKVLVVDDNAINIKVANKLLLGYGITADSCDSGAACLEKVKTTEYDLILLDDMMPHMSGVETLGELKKNPNYKTPTVALTANAITGMKEQYLANGFNDYLSKPIDKNELSRVLNEYLK